MRTVFSRETFDEGGQLYCQGGRGNKESVCNARQCKELLNPGNEREENNEKQKFKSAKRLYITVGKVFKEYVPNDGKCKQMSLYFMSV